MVFVAGDDAVKRLARVNVLDAARAIERPKKLADVESLSIIVKISLKGIARRDIHSLPKIVLRNIAGVCTHMVVAL